MTTDAIEVFRLSKAFRVYHERNNYLKTALLRGRRARYDEFKAVNDVSFAVSQGSTFGIIGANGSGKSTLLKCIAGVLSPDSGRISTTGRTAALLELGSGFHPDLSGRENVYLNGALLGLSQKEVKKKFEQIVDFAGLEQFIDNPVKNYSSGMSVRLGFSIAVSVDPELLIVDEVLAVGDAAFQNKCYRKIEHFRREGRTILLVSHGMGDITSLCSEVLWMDKGHARMIGRSLDIVSQYLGVSMDEDKLSETTGERWGSKEIEIVSVDVRDRLGRSLSTIYHGDDLVIAFDYVTHAPVANPIIGFRITNVHGTHVFATNSRRRDVRLSMRHNRGSIQITLPKLSLLPGSYEITLDVADHSEAVSIDHWGRCAEFRMVSDSTLDEGIVSLPVEWHDFPSS